MVNSLADPMKAMHLNAEHLSKPSAINGVKKEELDKLPEKDREFFLKNVETTNQLLHYTSFSELSSWDFDMRDKIYNNFPKIKELSYKDVHFNSITRVMIYGKVSLEKMLALDPIELRNMICRPGPESILWLLDKNITWDALVGLDPDRRGDVLSLHRSVIELLGLVSWDQIIGLPNDLFKNIIQQPHLIKDWMECGAEWKDVAATPGEVFQSLCVRPHRMINLLESASWLEIIGLESNLRTLALQKANLIFDWKTEGKLSWQDCLERLKTTDVKSV